MISLTVEPEDSETEVLGKDVSDLQSNISINSTGRISGVLKYVTDYTGFSGDTNEQSGNYLALKADAGEGATITVELVGGNLGHPVTLDADKNIVLRIGNNRRQSVKVVASKDGQEITKVYSLTDLTLESASASGSGGEG